ncbi:MAG TPA: hypothetical protein VM573_07040 [Actinomycetota bacterium]|nr:hypothetical protein [Actinomycetota bacterium]
MIASGRVVPHAPVLVPGMSQDPAIPRVMPVEAGEATVAVVISPHGATTGVYREAFGSFDRFGARGFERAAPSVSEAASSLAEGWGAPLLEGPLDHGCLVPLWWLPSRLPVIACSLADASPLQAQALASALAVLDERLLVVASAHLSAALSDAAPLTAIPGAPEFDREVLDALEGDPADLLRIDVAHGTAVGACGLPPLYVLAHLFRGGRGEVLAYDAPFGVGYVQARVEP